MSMSFDQLEQALKDVPKTWIPALIRTLVARAEEENVFKAGGLLSFVANSTKKSL